MDDKLKEVLDKLYKGRIYDCEQGFGYIHIYNLDIFELIVRFSTIFEYNMYVHGRISFSLEDNIYCQIYQLTKFIEYTKNNFGLYFKKEYNFKDYVQNIQFTYSINLFVSLY